MPQNPLYILIPFLRYRLLCHHIPHYWIVSSNLGNIITNKKGIIDCLIKNIYEKNKKFHKNIEGIWSKESKSLLYLLVNNIQWCLVGLVLLIIYNSAGCYLFWFCFSCNLFYKKRIDIHLIGGFLCIFTSDIPLMCSIISILFRKAKIYAYIFQTISCGAWLECDIFIQNKVNCYLWRSKLNLVIVKYSKNR